VRRTTNGSSSPLLPSSELSLSLELMVRVLAVSRETVEVDMVKALGAVT
jgi:hypothetical protein